MSGTADPPAPEVVKWLPFSVSLIWHRADEVPQEVSRDLGGNLLVKLDKANLEMRSIAMNR